MLKGAQRAAQGWGGKPCSSAEALRGSRGSCASLLHIPVHAASACCTYLCLRQVQLQRPAEWAGQPAASALTFPNQISSSGARVPYHSIDFGPRAACHMTSLQPDFARTNAYAHAPGPLPALARPAGGWQGPRPATLRAAGGNRTRSRMKIPRASWRPRMMRRRRGTRPQTRLTSATYRSGVWAPWLPTRTSRWGQALGWVVARCGVAGKRSQRSAV